MEVSFLKWILIFPLAGFLVNGLLGTLLSRRMSGIIACLSVGASFIAAVYASSCLGEHGVLHEHVMSWISAAGFDASVGLRLDSLSRIMILVVTGVGGLIHVYSLGYMAHDRSFKRYFAYLNLFTFAMLLLVLADNLILLFVGWEGVGLCSYLLIGFWFEDIKNSAAGKKAFIVNRIGDFGFILGLLTLAFGLHVLQPSSLLSLDFDRLSASVGPLSMLKLGGYSLIGLACLFLFIGATGKSAQIPLYVWLPDAMAGPTPVSALIHAATMVTAGVYMMARLNFLYVLVPSVTALVGVVAALTAFFAATVALQQFDIKKVLAYSTISQLGYMFAGVAALDFAAGVFHLATHAFFKALLFLGAGSVIHALSNNQDIRIMGGLRRKLPVTFWTFAVATAAIAGIPPLSGFFSKDSIIWASWVAGAEHGHVAWKIVFILLVVTSWLTAFYMTRLFSLTFLGENRTPENIREHIHESPLSMLVPLCALALLSAVGGFGFVGIHDSLVEFFRLHEIHDIGGLSEHMVGVFVTSVSVVVIGFALYLYVKIPHRAEAVRSYLSGAARVLERKYYIDEIYDATVAAFARFLSFASDLFDRYVIDGIVNAAALITRGIGSAVAMLQVGFVQVYAFFMLVGVLLLMGYVIWNL